MMDATTDSDFWRSLRKDFEELQHGHFVLEWNALLPAPEVPGPDEEEVQRLHSRPWPWSWAFVQFPDQNLRAQLGAIALIGAKRLGHDSESAWYNLLRRAYFVKFTPNFGWKKRSDSLTLGSETASGWIDDVVKHSIALCRILEANGTSAAEGVLLSQSSVAELNVVPRAKANGKGQKRGPRRDDETAMRVAEIVARVAPDSDCHSKLDDICEALDQANIPPPVVWWKRHRIKCWVDYPEKHIAIKAIANRLKIASKQTLS